MNEHLQNSKRINSPICQLQQKQRNSSISQYRPASGVAVSAVPLVLPSTRPGMTLFALGTGACFVGNTELSTVSSLTRVNSKQRHLKHRLLWIIQVRYKMICNCSPGTSDCPSLPSSNSLKHNRLAIQEATYPSKRMKESSPFPCCPKAAWETNSNYKNVNMWTHATVRMDWLTQGCHMFLVMKSTLWHISQ